MSFDLAPRLIGASLPEAERKAAHLISTGLMRLGVIVRDFEDALHLFDFSTVQMHHADLALKKDRANVQAAEALRVFSNWPNLAARDGAMSLYHFSEAFHGIRETFGACPTLRPLINHDALREANRVFRSDFPNFEEMRHAVAHNSDQTRNPDKHANHSFTGSYKSAGLNLENVSGMTFSNFLEDRTFKNTWNGQFISYELSRESHRKLDAVKNMIWEPFRRAEQVALAALRPKSQAPANDPSPS